MDQYKNNITKQNEKIKELKLNNEYLKQMHNILTEQLNLNKYVGGELRQLENEFEEEVSKLERGFKIKLSICIIFSSITSFGLGSAIYFINKEIKKKKKAKKNL